MSAWKIKLKANIEIVGEYLYELKVRKDFFLRHKLKAENLLDFTKNNKISNFYSVKYTTNLTSS